MQSWTRGAERGPGETAGRGHAAGSIALFRALQLGDLLCAVPALRAIRRAHREARITLVGLPWAHDFVGRFAYVDDFLAFPGSPGLPEQPADSSRLPAFLAAARARRFDLAIQMHGSGRLTNALVGQLGARRTAGFFPPGEDCPDAAHFIEWPLQQSEIHRLLALAAHLGCPPEGESLELPILPAEQRAFRELRAALPLGRRRYVCIHPGARLASRRWLPERFAAVADRLVAAGFAIVLTGSADEAALVAEVRERMHGDAIDLAGRTGLGTLAALVAEAALLVCNDTGISHVAAAVGTPSVVVSSGGDAERWRPLDRARHRVLWQPAPCRPCSHERCPTAHECAAGVTADAVIEQALRLLSGHREQDHA